MTGSLAGQVSPDVDRQRPDPEEGHRRRCQPAQRDHARPHLNDDLTEMVEP
jgi:hypothetical protein